MATEREQATLIFRLNKEFFSSRVVSNERDYNFNARSNMRLRQRASAISDLVIAKYFL